MYIKKTTNTQKHSQKTVKKNNLKLILDSMIKFEPVSRADLVRITHISKPTVSSLIGELIEKGIVNEIGTGKSKVGKKPILLSFNSKKKIFLGLEIGRVGYRIAFSDLKGRFFLRDRGEFSHTDHFENRLEKVTLHIKKLLSESNIDKEKILKVICLSPGVYVEKGKALKWFPGNEKNGNMDIKKYFESFFNKDVVLSHSTKLSLLGEKVSGKAKGHKNVLYIDFAYGLGCAIMIDGNIYFGEKYSAGEIGYIYSSREEFDNYTIMPYQFGALENHISGKSIKTKGIEAAKKYKGSLLFKLVNGNLETITAKTVFEAAKRGDQIAYHILKEAFSYFNMALSNLINIFSPEIVILGGGFSYAEDFLLELIIPEIENKVLHMPDIVISELKYDASLIGGIHYLIETTDYLREL